MKELKKLANEIVSELVDCGAADEEPVKQYEKWTLQRLEKAFRALEQRAEAAEANHQACTNELVEAVFKIDELKEKLAEYEKQEPVAWLTMQKGFCDDERVAITDKSRADEYSANCYDLTPLYSRPAPAVSLVELVPDELHYQMGDFPVNTASINSWNACRAAILRNIEDAK